MVFSHERGVTDAGRRIEKHNAQRKNTAVRGIRDLTEQLFFREIERKQSALGR